jgi:hypothetical protein
MLHSIQTIKHVYATGELPVLFECDDFNDTGKITDDVKKGNHLKQFDQNN